MKSPFFFKKLAGILFICAAGIFLSIAFKHNYAKLRELQTHYSLLKQKLILEGKRSLRLKKEQDGLTCDPHQIEKVAREKLGWCSPGETVYRFPEEKN